LAHYKTELSIAWQHPRLPFFLFEHVTYDLKLSMFRNVPSPPCSFLWEHLETSPVTSLQFLCSWRTLLWSNPGIPNTGCKWQVFLRFFIFWLLCSLASLTVSRHGGFEDESIPLFSPNLWCHW
jgi:hypothetical protein